MEPIAQDVRSGAEGKEELTAAGLVAHRAADLRELEKAIRSGLEGADGALGRSGVYSQKEVEEAFDVRESFGKPEDSHLASASRAARSRSRSRCFFIASWEIALPVSA